MYSVDTDVPVPAGQRGPRRGPKYPFATMPVNGSFLVPYEGREPLRLQSTLCTAAKRTGGADRAFTTARQDDGIRVWRIA